MPRCHASIIPVYVTVYQAVFWRGQPDVRPRPGPMIWTVHTRIGGVSAGGQSGWMLNLFDPSRSLFLSDECPKIHLGFVYFILIFAIVLCHSAAARLTQVHFNMSLMLRCFFRALVEEVGPSEVFCCKRSKIAVWRTLLDLNFHPSIWL